MIAKARASLVNASRGALGRRHDGCSAGTRGGSLASRGGGAPSAGLRLGLLLAVAAALLLVPASQAAAAAPEVTAISPDHGPWGESNAVTIEGSGFTGATAVDFGAVAAASFSVESDTEVLAHSPVQGGEPGDKVDVTVTTPEGTSASSVADEFEYTHEILKLNIEGSGAGEVIAAGGEYTDLEGTPPLDCHYDGATQSGACEVEMNLRVEGPGEEWEGVGMIDTAGSESEFSGWTVGYGEVESCIPTSCVAYSEPPGEGGVELTAEFTSTAAAAAPEVTAISPDHGPWGESNAVTIEGSGFTGATAVDFGAVAAASFSVESDTEVLAHSPVQGGEPGDKVNVTVTTPEGTSASSVADEFEYTHEILKLNIEGSGAGEVIAAGGEYTDLEGTPPLDCHYDGATQSGACEVEMNLRVEGPGEEWEGVGMIDTAGSESEFSGWTVGYGEVESCIPTSCVAYSEPPGEGGVELTAEFTSTAAAAAPEVTAISPDHGPWGESNAVTIEGSGFTGATAVDFGAVAAASFSVESDTEVLAHSPVQGGEPGDKVNVTVTTPEGTSASSVADEFEYTHEILKLNIEGSGAGEVIAAGGEYTDLEGTPPLDCHYDGATQSGACEVEMNLRVEGPGEEWEGVGMIDTAGSESEFSGWTVGYGEVESCIPTSCVAYSEPPGEGGVELTAEFTSTGGPGEAPLTINTNTGTGTGQVNCVVNGAGFPDEPCAAEYPEGAELELIAAEGAHSEFTAFENGSGNAAGCSTSPCATFTLNEASELDAVFDLIPHNLEVELSGAGEISGGPISECEDGGAGTCSGSAGESEAITLTATLPAHYEASWSGVTCTVETATECQFEMPAADTKVEVSSSRIQHNLEVELTGAGEISGGPIAGCEDGGAGTCSGSAGEGETITLTATEPHYEFTWTGVTCTVETATECQFEMPAADTKVEASSALEQVSLAVNVTGGATKQCEDVSEGGGPGACAGSYPYGHTVKVVVTADGHYELTALTGEGSAETNCTLGTGTCEFAIEEASTVNATAEPEAGTGTLTVWITGAGTISSEPIGLSCSGEECSGLFGEETVTLTPHPDPGYILAAWVGCHRIAGGKCEASVTPAGTEATAVFIAAAVITEFTGAEESPPNEGPCNGAGGVKVEYAGTPYYACNGEAGAQGNPGQDGETPNVEEFSNAQGPCTEGGTKIIVGATEAYACNGEAGTEGQPGQDGQRGQDGQNGAAGQNGASGADGQNGADGAQGPAGPQGKQGKTGKVKVTCKVKNKKKVVCKVKYVKSNKKHGKRHHLRWRLMSGGHATSHGKTSVNRLNRVLGHLRPGRYVLHVNGQKTVIVIPAHRRHDNHRHG